MKFAQAMKNKPYLEIVMVIAVLAIVCFAFFMSGLLQTAETQKDDEIIENITHEDLPAEVIAELDRIKLGHKVTKWEIDEQHKTITLYELHMDDDQINKLQGKNIDNWNITVKYDAQFLSEKEAALVEFKEMANNPELNISTFKMSYNKIIFLVTNLTPENQALDGKVVHRWTIHIYTLPKPSSKDLPKAVSYELARLKRNENITLKSPYRLTGWNVDEQQKIIILYEVYMDENQIDELQINKIDGWDIFVQIDMDYLNEIEAAQSEVKKPRDPEKEAAWATFIELQNNSELQISGFSLGADEVLMWVYNFTPENKALDGAVILNRTVHIYTSPKSPNRSECE